MTTVFFVTEPPDKPFVFDTAGKYVVFFHNVSGKYVFELRERDVQVYILGLFTQRGTDIHKIETVQHHIAPHSYSDLFIKGVFEDTAKFYYQGLIRIEKEGQQSHAYQKNQNLILSKAAYVESNPFLEILANDVFCTHGSTTGKLNREELFYARSRGLTPQSAQELLVGGFVQEVFDRFRVHAPDAAIPDTTYGAPKG